MAATRSPSTSPDVEPVRIGGLRPRFVPLLSVLILGPLIVRRRVREQRSKRTALRPPVQARIRNRFTALNSSRCHGDTPVRCRFVRSRTWCARSARREQRHPQSEWAGVSWRQDDDRERDAAEGIECAPVREAASATRARMHHFARSFASWHDRPHANVSSAN